MYCLSRPTSQYPFTVCLNAPAVGNITGIDGYVEPPPVVIPPNVTVYDAETSGCLDDRYFFQRVAVAAQNGSLIMNDKTTYCDNGCSNATLWNGGGPGCKEATFIQWIEIIIIVILVSMFGAWCFKNK
jgi:hypothetical protein